MDTVAIATYLVQGQMSLAQGELAATLINRQQDVQNQMLTLIDGAVQGAAASVPYGTGEFVNIIA